MDDLLIAAKEPQILINQLLGRPYNFKLKGTGRVTYHLGYDFFRDAHGVLCMAPRAYLERMNATFIQMFGEKPPTRIRSPLEPNDHPELDDSGLLDEEGIRKYQSLIGTFQWAISLTRFDIATAVMTMSSFRVAPREGHLARPKRICGYLNQFKHASLRVKTEEPDYSSIPETHYDWSRSVYGDVKEEYPADAPPPKGKRVVLTTYKDANLYHDLTTGRSVTGILHYLNKTPIDWFSKKQSTVETATYGSEFVAAKTAIQQISALRQRLRYLGVPIHGGSLMFGDNRSVVTLSLIHI